MPSKAAQRHNRQVAKDRRQMTREKAAERRRDTRQKVLVGEVLVDAAEDDPALQRQIQNLLSKHLQRPGDRELFGLPAVAPDPASSREGEQRPSWTLPTVQPFDPALSLPVDWRNAATPGDPLATAATRLRRDLQRRNRLAARIRRRSRRLVSDERRRETRRKILIGAIVLREAADNAALRTQVWGLLEAGLDRADKRDLFELPAAGASDPAPGREEGPTATLADAYRQASQPVGPGVAFNPAARPDAVAAGSRG